MLLIHISLQIVAVNWLLTTPVLHYWSTLYCSNSLVQQFVYTTVVLKINGI